MGGGDGRVRLGVGFTTSERKVTGPTVDGLFEGGGGTAGRGGGRDGRVDAPTVGDQHRARLDVIIRERT